MSDTIKHMWDQVEKARADGTFSSPTPSAQTVTADEHRVIWLEPSCVDEAGEDRHWCQDDAWGPCDDCGREPVKYIIASEHATLTTSLAAAEARVRELEKLVHDDLKSFKVMQSHGYANPLTILKIVDDRLTALSQTEEGR